MKKPAYFLIFFCFVLVLSLPVLAQDEEEDSGFVVLLPGSSLDGLFLNQNQAILLSETPFVVKNIFFEGYFLGLVGEDCQMAVENTLDFFAQVTAFGLAQGMIEEDDLDFSKSIFLALEAADLAEKFCLAGRQDKGKGLDFQRELISFLSK